MWIFFAFLSRCLWAGCNATDQVLSRAHKQSPAASAFILNFCATLPYPIIAFAMSDGNFASLARMIPWIVFGAMACFVALLPYYKSVQIDEAYNIVPYFELTPVFLTLMALVLHDESMSSAQIAGAALVIACGFLFSWDFHRGRVKARILAYMVSCAFLYALYQLALRTVGEGRDVWLVTGAFLTVETTLGFIALACLPRIRKSIAQGLKDTKGRTLRLALLTNLLSFLALVSLVYAFNTAPSTGHVAALSGTQPFFMFFLAVMLGKTLPQHFSRMRFDRETRIKLSLLAGIFAGIYLLVQS